MLTREHIGVKVEFNYETYIIRPVFNADSEYVFRIGQPSSRSGLVLSVIAYTIQLTLKTSASGSVASRLPTNPKAAGSNPVTRKLFCIRF